jgi:DNA-binding GntR family transcriptional regulator
MSAGPAAASIPHYVRIAADLRDKIMDGTYAPGALLPSRNEIIVLYEVSAITARDALALICQQGYARAIRGRGHVVTRKRSRMTISSNMYYSGPDPDVPLKLARLDVYQELAPDNIALPLQTEADVPVWVRRAVYRAADDLQPVQIHVSWINGLGDDAEAVIRAADPAVPWPEVVAAITRRDIVAISQHVRARRSNPFESDAFGFPEAAVMLVAHLTTYDAGDRPVEHSRYAWPVDAVRVSGHYAYPPPG